MKITQHAAGTLTVTAESSKEVQEVFKHFALDSSREDFIKALVDARYVLTLTPAKRLWYPVSAEADARWLAPYFDLLRKITGFTGDLGDIEGAPCSDYSHILMHTHIVTESWIRGGKYGSRGFISSEDWNGQTAEKRAEINFTEYVQNFLGTTYNEPEYVTLGNGLLQHNKNYLKRHHPQPALASQALWATIFETWLARHATEGQKALLVAAKKCHQTVCKGERAFTDSLMREYRGVHTDNYTKSYTFADIHAA